MVLLDPKWVCEFEMVLNTLWDAVEGERKRCFDVSNFAEEIAVGSKNVAN